MYLLTEDMPEVAAQVAKTGHEMPMALDFAGEIYIRQEGGRCSWARTSRRACRGRRARRRGTSGRSCSAGSRPDHARAVGRVQALPGDGHDRHPRVVNGPFTFSPDGNPLVGPIRGLRGYWVACGVMAGLSQGGGVGLALATWMTAGDDGDSGMDIWAMDVARYGDYATLAYTNAKVQENYRRRFRSRSRTRSCRTRGRCSRRRSRPTDGANAVWGATFGLEHALWFQRAASSRRRT